MKGFGRGRSLFWTIAAIFLLTTVVGTLLQALVATAVLQPLEAREARARAELAASAVAGAIATGPNLATGADLDSLLERHREAVRPAWIVFRGSDGSVASAPPWRFIAHALADRSGRDSSSFPPARPDPRGPLEVVARRGVMRGPTVLGEVQVVRRTRPRGAMGIVGSQNSILLFPIAIVVSAFGGLVLVRLLVRRLRAMELLATRVAEGDLTVRLADRSGDEIGRLAQQLNRMTERLAVARAQIEATELERRQLFADITHELATPLTSIRGYAETLLDPRVPVSQEERTQYVRGLLDESRRMDLLIRDLFELARLEAGAAPLSKEPLDWASLCRNTIERFEPRFRRAGLSLSWHQSVDEAWIDADGHRMEQVLENLLVNALRYVPEGGSVQLDLAAGKGERFLLVVGDNGPGIPAAELPLVFKRFYRGAGSGGGPAPDHGGSGLGLAIVREIVERHGGTVRAQGNGPRGLAITVELPRRRAEAGGRVS
ncbi:MAG: HAMP domain-containing histidine kinase [Candidatus Eisenbacteria bacterium]|uniref:Signal transduction histidine-protein kinase/phosphatase MprB n=1 Tax=Eiseniibacteriota bacterium TaxID=2212470 RepID=A0A538T9A6_UNCEI|nr:MAG: HAMP domain-containing histidine kinase [Candidatus Eisenbacteria bacterium]